MQSVSPLKVIIVDDEEPILQRLQLFDWSGFGAEIAGVAENGEEALDLCARVLPDIVFTDIKMPVMTGLELLRQVTQEYPEISVVLLTSYNEFDYVRQALKLGATDYLMKVTLSAEELAQTVDKSRQWIRSRLLQKEQERGEARKRKSQRFRVLLTQPPERTQALLQELVAPEPLPAVPFRFVRALVQAKREDEWFVDQEAQSILNALQQRLKPGESAYWHWFPVGACDYLLWFPQPLALEALTEEATRIRALLRTRLAETLTYLDRDAAVYLTLSSEVVRYEEFRDAFRETFYWIDHCFFQEAADALFIGTPPPLVFMDDKTEFELRTAFRSALADVSSFPRYVRNDFKAWVVQRRIHPSAIRSFVQAELAERDAGVREPGAAPGEPGRGLEQCATLSELISHLIYWVERKRDDFIRTEIRQAKETIQARLGEPLTLAGIAQEVGLSPDYFGRLFHEQVGETFKEYVTRCRIEKAIELLQTTNLKVYTVSEQVGFPSYRYFAPLFRKVTGLSPSDFKRG